MSVTVASQGAGQLKYPGTPNLKPALVNGEGWWSAFWLHVTTTTSGATTLQTAADMNNDGATSSASEASVGVTRTNVSDANSKRIINALRNSSGSEVWAQAGATGTFTAMPEMTLGNDYLVVWGVCDLTGSGDWRLWRAVVEKNGSVLATEVTAGHASVTTFATSAHRVRDRILSTGGTNSRTLAGSGLEHVLSVKGVFPFTAGVPTTAILEGLADGTYRPDDAAVLAGGDILDWRVLETNADLANSGSNGVGDLTVDGTVDTASRIAPDSWFDTAITFDATPDGDVYEGVLGAANNIIRTGGKADGEDLEYQVELATAGTVITAWTDAGLTYPTSTTWEADLGALAIRTDGDRYRLRMREAANPSDVFDDTSTFQVGAVVVVNDQSQLRYLAFSDSTTGMSVTPNNCCVQYLASRDGPTSAAPVVQITATNSYGSGYVEMANQIATDLGYPHLPVKLVAASYEGHPVQDWIADDATDGGSGWGLYTGFMTATLEACHGRVTAIIRDPVVANAATIAAQLDTWAGMVDTLLVNQPGDTPFWLMPCNREGNQATCWDIKKAVYDLAVSGGRWKLFGHLDDWQMDGDGSKHPSTGDGTGFNDADAHAAGARRGGTRFGRCIASIVRELLSGTAIDRLGPSLVSRRWADPDRYGIDFTYDRAVEVPAGGTTGWLQYWVDGADDWATKADSGSGTIVAERVASNVVRLTRVDEAAFDPDTKSRYLFDNPWDTASGAFGGEASIRSKLDLLTYDTTSIEGGRGMPAAPNFDDGTVGAYQAPGGARRRRGLRMGLGLR